jgi:hypothetical protein
MLAISKKKIMFDQFLEVITAFIISLIMEALSTSETSVNFYETTRRNITESHLYTRCHENLMSHLVLNSRPRTERRQVQDAGCEDRKLKRECSRKWLKTILASF